MIPIQANGDVASRLRIAISERAFEKINSTASVAVDDEQGDAEEDEE